MNKALALIKKCLANKEPVLDLGNCGRCEEDLRISSEVGQQLSRCTHITKLVLSNREYEWELDNTPLFEIDLRDRNEYRKVDNQLPYRNSWHPTYIFFLRDKRPVIPTVVDNMNHFIAIPEVVAASSNLEEFVCGGEYEERWEIALIEWINTSQERKIKVSVEGSDKSVAAEIFNLIVEIDPAEDLEISVDEVNFVSRSALVNKMQRKRLEIDATNGEPLPVNDFRYLFDNSPIGNTTRTIRIFVSYSNKDTNLVRLLVDRLQSHLLCRTGFDFHIWTDQSIDLGADWDAVIKREIEKSDLALLFVSASYIASPYVRKEELGAFFKKMQEDKFTMLPVLLRDCDFTSFETLSGIQFFQAKYLDYGFKKPHIRDKFMSFDVLGENEDATDQQLNSYYKNLADKIFDTVNNKF